MVVAGTLRLCSGGSFAGSLCLSGGVGRLGSSPFAEDLLAVVIEHARGLRVVVVEAFVIDLVERHRARMRAQLLDLGSAVKPPRLNSTVAVER